MVYENHMDFAADQNFWWQRVIERYDWDNIFKRRARIGKITLKPKE